MNASLFPAQKLKHLRTVLLVVVECTRTLFARYLVPFYSAIDMPGTINLQFLKSILSMKCASYETLYREQGSLFPWLLEELGPLTGKQQELLKIHLNLLAVWNQNFPHFSD